jgi:acetyl-CoA C-acetyltransferase
MAVSLSGSVAIVGAYESPRRKADGIHPFQIHAECAAAALEDAGLDWDDVDGFCTTAGDVAEAGATESIIEVAEYLGIRPTYFDSTDVGGCSYIAHAGRAAAAISAGLTEVVLITQAACPRWWPLPFPDLNTVSYPVGPGEFEVPYAGTIISNYAMVAQRHMHQFGTTSEQLARIAVTCRANAANNENARFRDPLSVEQVVESRMIASPLHKFDCCVITDSGGAIVMTSAERAKDCRREPVFVLGFGSAIERIHMNRMRDLTVTPGAVSGPRAMEMAGIKPDEVDVAQLYDAFTITPLLALEDLGFCAKGEGGPFVESGAIDADGSLPINTDGGGLSSNHTGKRGMFAMIEGVRQLRGEGPGVQVNDPKISLVHGWGGNFSAAATLVLGV